MSKSYKGLILFILCIAGSFAGGYLYNIDQIDWSTIAIRLAIALVAWAVIIGLGLYFAQQGGFKVLFSADDDWVADFLVPGLIGGLIVIAATWLGRVTLFKEVCFPLIKPPCPHPPLFLQWGDEVLHVVRATINAEVFLRLFSISGVAWLLTKLSLSKKISAWLSIIILSFACLGVVAVFPCKPKIVYLVSYLFLQGFVMGWLYWRYSLVTAIFANAVAYGGVFYLIHQLLPCIMMAPKNWTVE